MLQVYELDEDIVNYIKRKYNTAIGETTAEEIKKEVGCAMPLMTEKKTEITLQILPLLFLQPL